MNLVPSNNRKLASKYINLTSINSNLAPKNLKKFVQKCFAGVDKINYSTKNIKYVRPNIYSRRLTNQISSQNIQLFGESTNKTVSHLSLPIIMYSFATVNT